MFRLRLVPPVLGALVAVALAAACASTLALGTVTARGFDHATFPYRVMAGPGGAIMPRDWHLDNFQLKRGAYVPKTTDDYQTRYELDFDDDGRADDMITAARYDLRFTNRRYNGEIWLRTIPLSASDAELELPVVLRRYVENIAGSGFTVTRFTEHRVTVQERRFAARVLDYTPVTVHGIEALVATIEVANVDQLQLDSSARGERARLVFLRAPFRFDWKRWDGQVAPYHVLLAAGYVASPTDFDRGVADFQGLVARLVFEAAPAHIAPGVVQTGATTVLVATPGSVAPTAAQPAPVWTIATVPEPTQAPAPTSETAPPEALPPPAAPPVP